MSFLATINGNGFEVLTSLVVANVSAQVFKTIIHALQHKKPDLRMLFTTGGMPSSHSASVVAMATTVGLLEGFSSVTFALALTFAIIVMYDSAGVRQAAGRQAAALNIIVKELLSDKHKLNVTKFKELLGHSPKEVFFGALLGLCISLWLRSLVGIS